MPLKHKATKASLTAMLSMAATLILAPHGNAQEKAFLWEIESPNNTVYLLGSIHFLRPTDYPLAPSIQTAFDEAENVVFEVDIADTDSPETVQTFLQAAAPDGPDERLATALDDATYRLAEEVSMELGIPLIGFNNLEPWAFYLSVASLQATQLGFEPDYGVDFHYYSQAVQQNKPILTLETIPEQLSFFDQLSASVQADLVEQTLLELDNFEDDLNNLVAAWKVGDVNGFERLVLDGFNDYPEAYDAILVQRNQNWIPAIESFINQSEDYLVVVGGAHLVGDSSVIALLEDQGYTVQQVDNN